MKRHAAEVNRIEIIRLCHSALDSRTLRAEVLRRLRAVIPFEYAYFSTTDPATQLSTGSVLVEEPPDWCMAIFLNNEYLQPDFNKFSEMVHRREAVALLSEATGKQLDRSQRYLDMLLPLTMGDELRAVFVTDAACWGTLCLHREHSASLFTSAEADFLAQLAPHIADGLRKALLLSGVSAGQTPDAPGVLVLGDHLEIAAVTPAADYWLTELTEGGDRHALPRPIRTVIAKLTAIEGGFAAPDSTPKIRLRTPSGQWLVVHASRLRSAGGHAPITVIFEAAQPLDIAPLMMQAYLLTKREGDITGCVLRGWSTNEIAAALHISANTVQDHLKAIFAKVDVSSRGELAARIFTEHYRSSLL